VAAQAATVRRTTSPAPDRAAARPDPSTTGTLVEASAEGRRVRLGYRSEAGREWTTDVDPWAVVVRHGRWYLVCRSVRADAVRAYRIDRVTAVDVLDEPVDPPPPVDLDPVETLEDNLASGWEYATEVRVEAPADDVRRRLPRTLGRVEPVDDRTCRIVGSTSNPVWYAEQLAVLAVPYRVLGGPEVRRAVRALGLRLLSAAADD
jgi:predicted DNA-binding transcriptional regulator YafY